ncbi:tyrosine-type recombinase/integrase [Vreelandella rituensis]|uniref:tyrosine-type recombinase/integrase n=1 Tax=Vreelandella rituensis TaxID=2282306 RepID=UPI001F37204A|nr:tyrosine-type recombinase/integrase [Halomonas rituensis]
MDALQAPTRYTLDAWLNTPRLAKCGRFFTPTELSWWPDRTAENSVNWQAALAVVAPEWQRWLHAALAYRMLDMAQGSVVSICSVMSRAAQAGLNILNEDHLINLRERFSNSEFALLVSFIEFWQTCESVEQGPSQSLNNAYKTLPRKKSVRKDAILSLDPEQGPYTQVEQDALHLWIHEQFCHGQLVPEQYLYLRLLMIYGQRGVQLRMMVFDDFIKTDQGHKIRIFWAKQRGDDEGWRKKVETFSLDEDLYNTVQAYKAILLAKLWQEYPDQADWDKAINHVPLFRRKVENKRGGNTLNPPVLIDLPNQKALEYAPQPEFHTSSRLVRSWLAGVERMAGFPISHRTHQPLKISRGHRFRHTFGTDLSNAGLEEWAMARALMHKNSQTVRKYRAVSAELMNLIDAKMSDHLALVVSAFTGTIVRDQSSAKNGNQVDRQIEDLAICGADAVCHLDAPFTCYGCGKFQPLLEADHTSVLERLERRRAQIITDKTTAVLWDRAILACRKVILDCQTLRQLASS